MDFQVVSKNDIEIIQSFYKEVSNHTSTMATYGRWIYGIYPTDKIIRDYILHQHMFVLKQGDSIYGAVGLTIQDESYHGLNWSIELEDNQVLVVHVLAVHPNNQRQGIAKKMMQEIISYAKKSNKKAIRLDALESNQPAHKLYESLGFIKRDICHWYADNTGWTNFYLFEYVL